MTLITSILSLCLALCGDGLDEEEKIHDIQTVEWDVFLEDWFDPRWIFPPFPEEALEQTLDLPSAMQTLATARFEPTSTQEGEASLWSNVQCLGDVLAIFKPLRGQPQAKKEHLKTLQAERPEVWQALEPWLKKLVRDESLFGPDWNANKDEKDDGFATADPWSLDLVDSKPWNDLVGSKLVHQVATLMYADLDALTEAEVDFVSYRTHRHILYEKIGAVPGTLLQGKDPFGSPFFFLKIAFRCDLPFPFTGYEADLDMLLYIDEMGKMVRHYHTSRGSFHWMVGRDVCIPVRDGAGNFVAMLVVRSTGFDIAGVPDGDSDRAASTRVYLGNLRVHAEEIYRQSGSKARTVSGKMPPIAVPIESIP